MELPDKARDLLMDAQTHSQQLQLLQAQKTNIDMQLTEIEEALNSLEGKEEAYKEVGGILIKENVDTLREELKEKKELLTLQKENLEKKEKSLQEKLKDIEKELKEILPSLKGAG